MTSTKISGFADGSPPQSADNFVIQRGVSNFKMPYSSLAAAFVSDMFSPLVSAEISITGADTATISRMHVCSGSSDYTVTLPASAGNAGKFVGVRFTNTGVTTIDGDGSETIDGSTTRPYRQGETAIFICDGSNWYSLVNDVYPRSWRAFQDEAVSSVSQSIAASTSQPYGFSFFQSSAANGDYFDHGVFIKKGAYTCYALGATANSAGFLDWTLNGASITTGQDWYSVGTTYNVTKSFSLTVPYSGHHVLRATVNGKNASSSGYFWSLTKIWIKPSAY